jgi:hypothetical protein
MSIKEERYLISSHDLDDIKKYIRAKRRPGAVLEIVGTLISVSEEEEENEIVLKPVKIA